MNAPALWRVVAVSAALLVSSCGAPAAGTPPPDVAPARTSATVAAVAGAARVRLAGRLVLDDATAIVAAPTQARLVRIVARPGTTIAAGTAVVEAVLPDVLADAAEVIAGDARRAALAPSTTRRFRSRTHHCRWVSPLSSPACRPATVHKRCGGALHLSRSPRRCCRFSSTARSSRSWAPPAAGFACRARRCSSMAQERRSPSRTRQVHSCVHLLRCWAVLTPAQTAQTTQTQQTPMTSS